MGDLRIAFKKIEPFIAIGILAMLIIVGVLLSNEHKLKREISENCGWGEDDYYCYCERSQAMEVKNRAEMQGLNPLDFSRLEVEDVKVAG